MADVVGSRSLHRLNGNPQLIAASPASLPVLHRERRDGGSTTAQPYLRREFHAAPGAHSTVFEPPKVAAPTVTGL